MSKERKRSIRDEIKANWVQLQESEDSMRTTGLPADRARDRESRPWTDEDRQSVVVLAQEAQWRTERIERKLDLLHRIGDELLRTVDNASNMVTTLGVTAILGWLYTWAMKFFS